MKQSTKQKLIANSNAITHYLFQKDEDGLPELTPKAAAVGFIVIGIVFLLVSAWAK